MVNNIDIKNISGTQKSNYKRAADRIGISFEEYIMNLNNGFKWCSSCKKWLVYADNFKIQRVYCNLCTYNKRAAPEYRKKEYKSNLLYAQTPRGRFASYKHGAKSRKILFNIDFDYFMNFWAKPCSYCGDNIETIGLDRINNNIGYIENNIISCCYDCNIMKSNHDTKKWLDKMAQILKFSGAAHD